MKSPARRVRSTFMPGPTTATRRRTCGTQLRDEANILLTNPDMLHYGILPHHARWAEFFARLSYVVVDEIHVYRGIFGSHVANVLRRCPDLPPLRRRSPVILASATIANPSELAERLTGRRGRAIDEDGSPRGRKHFLFWNPPRLGRGGDGTAQRRISRRETCSSRCSATATRRSPS